MTITAQTKLEHALSLAAMGFYVFRLQRNRKIPFEKGWQEEATTNPEAITALFENHNFNIGIFTGKFGPHNPNNPANPALAVVDVDTKEDKQGDETMDNLEILGFEFPPTFTVTTASGGRHLYYHNPYPLSGGAGKVGTHVDLKSHGGYVVAPGSEINGQSYRVTHNQPLAEVPTWLKDKTGIPLKREAAHATADLDTPGALLRAEAYIKTGARKASSSRNDTAYKTACDLRDFGISESRAQELMQEWNANNLTRPLPAEKIATVTTNAYNFAKNPPGTLAAAQDFTPKPNDPKDIFTPATRTLYALTPKDIRLQPNPIPQLIENTLDHGAFSVLYGESNTGKTFVAMDLAFHIATGKPWQDKRTYQGAALYVAAEGGRSAENRILALKQKHSIEDFPLYLAPCAIDLFHSNADTQPLVTLLQTLEETHKTPIRLIVIDTLARALAGGNENSPDDMGAFIRNTDEIRAQTKAHLLVVHHSGKDTSKGARGHSSLRAATDTELEITGNAIYTRKQRDMEFSPPLGFELETLTLGFNAYDSPITSCVVNPIPVADIPADNEDQSSRLSHRDLIAFLALKECKTNRQRGEYLHVVELKEWAKACEDFDITLVPGGKKWPQTEEGFRKAFRRCRDRLIGFGKVVEIEGKQYALVSNGTMGQSMGQSGTQQMSHSWDNGTP